MSRYEWERGNIVIPARQWKSFVAEVLAGVDKSTVESTGKIEVDCGGEAFYYLRPDTHTVFWDVGENNHAQERAREEPNARVLFKALGKIKWGRGSGGDIIGNDEYNRDDCTAGGGGNYVVESFGPKKKRRNKTLIVGGYYLPKWQ